jgi:hypothetical protein
MYIIPMFTNCFQKMPSKERAIAMKRALLDGHGMGAYTHSKGTLSFRQDVARIKDPRVVVVMGS